MEPENQNIEQNLTKPLFKVTSLSKYLAMILFILMPFLGGYVGYMYAPEKVLVTERVIVKNVENKSPVPDETVISNNVKETLSETPKNNDVYEPFKELIVESIINGMKFVGFKNNVYGTDVAVFDGEIEIEGYIVETKELIPFKFTFTENGSAKIPWVGNIEDYGVNCLIVLGLEKHPLNDQMFTINEFESRSPTTTIKISGMEIFDPTKSNWCHESELIL